MFIANFGHGLRGEPMFNVQRLSYAGNACDGDGPSQTLSGTALRYVFGQGVGRFGSRRFAGDST